MTSADLEGVRRSLFPSAAPVTGVYDFNRDRRVNSGDVPTVRRALGNAFTTQAGVAVHAGAVAPPPATVHFAEGQNGTRRSAYELLDKGSTLEGSGSQWCGTTRLWPST